MRCPSVRGVFVVLLVLAVAASVLAGCGRGSMVGRRADDFSAYYNTFYNAEKVFDEGIEALEDIEDPVDQDHYVSVFVEPGRVNNASSFKKTIDKSADVLRDHPGSKWVDDALLLIGKSYYYQENYVGAKQKFDEAITREDSEVKDEARLWLGRTLLSAGRYDAAERTLLEGLEKGQEEEWRAKMKLALGDLRVRQGNGKEALPLLAEGVSGVGDGRVRARSLFLRGQVLERLGRYAEAAAAYRSAAAERPRYEMTYAAQTSALRMMARAGRAPEALRRLQRLENDDKNSDKRAALRLLRGQILQVQGRPDAARRVFDELLYQDPDAPDRLPLTGAIKGRAHYALATLYRDAYQNFSKAAAHFDTASSSLGQKAPRNAGEETAGRLTTYAVVDARTEADRYGNVAEAGRRLSRLDSLLRLGALPQSDFDAFVDSLRRARAEEQRAAAEREERRRTEQRFRGGRRSTQNRRGGGAQGGRFNNGGAGAGDGGNAASFLYYDDPARVLEGRRSFERTWGRRPRVPNWRRIAAISSQRNATSPGQPTDEVGPDERGDATVLPQVDVSAVPRDTARRRAMRTERATARYALGNALLLSAGRPDSAAVWFQRVIDGVAGRSVRRRAYYALAEAERANGQQKEARQRYRQILQQYPGTEIARRARVRLKQDQQAQDQQPGEVTAPPPAARNESAAAEAKYARAYDQWQRGQYGPALQGMVDVAAAHARSQSAPKALLAAAHIYMEQADREQAHDSTDAPPSFTAPLRVHVPDSLFEAGALFGADTLAAGASPEPPSPEPPSSPPDTAASRPDTSRKSVAVRSDSTSASGDSLVAARSDSSARAGIPPARDSTVHDSTSAPAAGGPAHALHLEGLLAGLVRRYPNTPHAARAERILRALRRRRAPPEESVPPADSTAPADSTRQDTTLVDSTATASSEEPSPSEEEAPPQGRMPEQETGRDSTAGKRSPGAIERAAGGWTVVVASLEDRAEAEALAQRFRERYRTGVIEAPPEEEGDGADKDARYQVAVGQFSTRREAKVLQKRLSSATPRESRLLRLGPKRN